ncbi:lachrymatory-factor synthase-like [Oryza brachyantha]|uniref:lachrymatory-factor synthase-like n=1 Tax=Oryza brachyantha TaxID=4533 RepID=UPI001ADB5B79|nr:lachrymatory-factor synthase-like [Oryza brachyantha]
MAAARELEWTGRVTAAAPAATADEAWALLSDFSAFHRWHPRVAKCRRVSGGSPRSPGCVRYCEGVPGRVGGGGGGADWAHETLLEHDAAGRMLRYEMNDNNMGFGTFFATLSVVDAAGAGAGGCELRWEFECEPVAGTAKEALVARLQDGIDGMARRVQEALSGRRAGDVKLGTSIAVGGATNPCKLAL